MKAIEAIQGFKKHYAAWASKADMRPTQYVQKCVAAGIKIKITDTQAQDLDGFILGIAKFLDDPDIQKIITTLHQPTKDPFLHLLDLKKMAASRDAQQEIGSALDRAMPTNLQPSDLPTISSNTKVFLKALENHLLPGLTIPSDIIAFYKCIVEICISTIDNPPGTFVIRLLRDQ